jgi:hypothetical protein
VLVADVGVDVAAQATAGAVDAADAALVRADAGPDLGLAPLEALRHEIGVGDRRPHHRHEVGRSAREDRLGLGQIHDPPGDDRRDVEEPRDLGRVRNLVAVGRVQGGDDRVTDVEAADREVHVVDEAGGRELRRDPSGVLD